MKTALRLLLATYRFSVANLFRMGEQGGVYYPDNPDALLRRVNLLSSTAALSTQSITATPRQQTLSFKGTGTVTLSGASTAGPLVGTGASDRVTLTFTPTAASLTLTVTGTVTEAQLELGPAFTTYQPVTTWTTDYMAAVGHLVTQFTDSAGTTPVTKVTDPVGLTLDRRFGLYRGPQLLTSGAIGLTGSATAATFSTTTGAGTVTRVDASNQSWVQFSGLTAGRSYQIAVSGVSGGTLQVRDGSATGTVIASTTSGTPCLVTATGTTITLTASAAATVAFTVTQIQWLPGNHRIQATSGSRKTLSARVNLLTKTEQFDDAAWSKLTAGTGSAAVVTANAGTDPLGGSTADRVVFARGAGTTLGDYSLLSAGVTGIVSGASHLGSVCMKSNTGSAQTVSFYLASFSSAVVNQVIGTTWTRVPVSLTSGTTSMNFVFGTRGGAGYTSDQDLDILVWGADLRTADDAAKAIPAYQRVNTATDYDTDGFPHFFESDGTDDSDATAATVDGSASDKVTAIVGVTKLSDAAAGIILEHTASTAANNGSFLLLHSGIYSGGDRLTYATETRGTVGALSREARAFTAPHSGVVTAALDNGANTATLRVNGVTPTGSAANSTSAGNFANATMYFGRRGGSTIPAKLREYATIIRFGPMSDSERNQAERWVAQRMGVTI